VIREPGSGGIDPQIPVEERSAVLTETHAEGTSA
jgi:hypothetical protein